MKIVIVYILHNFAKSEIIIFDSLFRKNAKIVKAGSYLMQIASEIASIE